MQAHEKHRHGVFELVTQVDDRSTLEQVPIRHREAEVAGDECSAQRSPDGAVIDGVTLVAGCIGIASVGRALANDTDRFDDRQTTTFEIAEQVVFGEGDSVFGFLNGVDDAAVVNKADHMTRKPASNVDETRRPPTTQRHSPREVEKVWVSITGDDLEGHIAGHYVDGCGRRAMGRSAVRKRVVCSAVANEKRQRQDALRAQKLAEAKVIEGKQRARATQKRIAIIAAVLVGLLAIFALLTRGNSDSPADTTIAPVASTTSLAPTTTVALKLPAAISSKPKVDVPAGPPPKDLQTKDLVVGTGPEVKTGANVVVNYVGVSWSTKKEFDASWARSPFTVENVGQASVIPGWNEGLIGMKEGGRRQLIIPPGKAYGPSGQGPDIGPNETLVFVVDAIKVTPKAL
jgi:peptidylprolyl isomerase